jgi:hypothetical protein
MKISTLFRYHIGSLQPEFPMLETRIAISATCTYANAFVKHLKITMLNISISEMYFCQQKYLRLASELGRLDCDNET